MSLLDSIKKGTGIGLSHSEHYNRAYERGVLLGVAKYAEAPSLFDEAARRAQQAGDHRLQMRALANSALYGFISSGNPQHLAVAHGEHVTKRLTLETDEVMPEAARTARRCRTPLAPRTEPRRGRPAMGVRR